MSNLVVRVGGAKIVGRVSQRNFNRAFFGPGVRYGEVMRDFAEEVAELARGYAPLGNALNYGSDYHKGMGSVPGTLKASISAYESKELAAAETAGAASRCLVGASADTPYAQYVENGTNLGSRPIYTYSWAGDIYSPGTVKGPRKSSGQAATNFMLKAWQGAGGKKRSPSRARKELFGGGKKP